MTNKIEALMEVVRDTAGHALTEEQVEEIARGLASKEQVDWLIAMVAFIEAAHTEETE